MSGKNLIGLDIGSYYTKIVELSNKKGVISVEKAIKERTPDIISQEENFDVEVMSEFIGSLFSQYKIKNRNVAVALNSSFVITKTINMPLVVDDEIEQAVMWEAEQYAPFGMDQVNVSYQVMDKDSEKNEMKILVVLTKKDIVNSYIDSLKKARIKLKIVDVDVFAMTNALLQNEVDIKAKHNMLVDLGYSSTKVIFVNNGVPEFSRYIEFGFKSILEEASSTFDIPVNDVATTIENLDKTEESKKDSLLSFIVDKTSVLYSQLQNSISFYENNVLNVSEDIENIVFSGAIGVLFEYLKDDAPTKFMNKNVIRLNPFNIFSIKDSTNRDTNSAVGSLYSIAVGLAVRGL